MKRLLAIALALAGAGLLSSCWGTVGVADEGYDYGYGYPPNAYVATAAPVYYDGYPNYWWGGRWYGRYGGGWHAYREEPEYLRSYRTHWASPPRANYGRGQYYGHAHGFGGFHHHR